MSLIYFRATIVCLIAVLWAVYGSEIVNLNRCMPDNFCDNFRCTQSLKKGCPDGVIRENASICGCCPVCVKQLNEDEPCLNVRKPLKGKPHQECRDGLRCSDTTGRCELIKETSRLSACLHLRALRKEIFENSMFKIESANLKSDRYPECETDGTFKARQCNSHKCFCVAPRNGQRILGQMPKPLANNMTCGCSRALFDKSIKEKSLWMTAPEMHCTSNGNFQEAQCVGRECFCADELTGQPTSEVIGIELFPKLDCNKGSVNYLSRCEKDAIRETKLRSDWERKGMLIKDPISTRCDYTGMFDKKQCNKTSCYCTDEKGTVLKDYKLSSDEAFYDDYKMGCQCARDEYENEMHSARYSALDCTSSGGTKPRQMIGRRICHCVDEEGNQLTENENCDLLKEDDCTNLAEKLKEAEKSVIDKYKLFL